MNGKILLGVLVLANVVTALLVGRDRLFRPWTWFRK